MSINENLKKLKSLIITKKEALSQYAAKPNANRYVLKKENYEIEQLTNIYNSLLNKKDFDFELSSDIEKYRNEDSEICGVFIHIQFSNKRIAYEKNAIIYKTI